MPRRQTAVIFYRASAVHYLFGSRPMQADTIQYRRLFETTVARLAAIGISATFSHGATLTLTQIDDFEQECGESLPSSIRGFYADVGDGLEFQWFIDRSNSALPFCHVTVPQLAELTRTHDYMHSLNSFLSDHDFHEAQDRDLARCQYLRQLSFFPFLQDNADLLCIERSGDKEIVVFHDREWSFCDSGDSGVLIAGSLTEFWHGWSGVGFVAPKHAWWPGTTGVRGTEWSVEHFGFCLARAEQSHALRLAAGPDLIGESSPPAR